MAVGKCIVDRFADDFFGVQVQGALMHGINVEVVALQIPSCNVIGQTVYE
jgi:hypothetical protein